MEIRQVDVAIIGAGTAGLRAYRAARKFTTNLVMIECGPYGTTCARVGCMPSKLLIAAADAAYQHRHTELFGVQSMQPVIDGVKVMERVRRERDRFAGFIIESIDAFPPEHKIKGQARFLDDNRLEVDGSLIVEARRIVIASGSRPSIPPMLQKAGNRLLVSDQIFELPDLPRTMAVFGPGVIGLELGQALSRLGVDIRVFGLGGSLGLLKDPEVSDYAEEIFNREFYLDTDADVQSLDVHDDAVAITYNHCQRGVVTEAFDYILAVTGRVPNLETLDLHNTSLSLTEKGMPVFDRFTMQCGDSHIFIAGDANNDIPLLHEAADQGQIAGSNAGRYPDVRSGLRRAPLAVVFSDPQIAKVGLSLQEVQTRCGKDCYSIGKTSFEDQGRSRVMGKNVGLLKVYGEQGTGLFLGAEMFGPAAEHIAHLLSWAVQQRLTVSQILDMPFYHPVIEEGVRTAFRDLNRQLRIGPEVVERCLDCGPGA